MRLIQKNHNIDTIHNLKIMITKHAIINMITDSNKIAISCACALFTQFVRLNFVFFFQVLLCALNWIDCFFFIRFLFRISIQWIKWKRIKKSICWNKYNDGMQMYMNTRFTKPIMNEQQLLKQCVIIFWVHCCTWNLIEMRRWKLF